MSFVGGCRFQVLAHYHFISSMHPHMEPDVDCWSSTWRLFDDSMPKDDPEDTCTIRCHQSTEFFNSPSIFSSYFFSVPRFHTLRGIVISDASMMFLEFVTGLGCGTRSANEYTLECFFYPVNYPFRFLSFSEGDNSLDFFTRAHPKAEVTVWRLSPWHILVSRVDVYYHTRSHEKFRGIWLGLSRIF